MSTMKRMEMIILHHSATRHGITAKTIRKWHTDKGWDDIGYHFVIESSGLLKYGRSLPINGAHAPPNSNRIGICLIGNNTKAGQEWRIEQILTCKLLLVSLKMIWPNLIVNGHRDVMKPGHTECPGIDIDPIFNRGV